MISTYFEYEQSRRKKAQKTKSRKIKRKRYILSIPDPAELSELIERFEPETTKK